MMTVPVRGAATESEKGSGRREAGRAAASVRRSVTVGLTAFLTLVDLFAMQAILPSLVQRYHVAPAAMGVAVNSSTLGMAIASLGVAVLGGAVNRRTGTWLSLAILAIPTTLLAIAPDPTVFALLRFLQGLCMASAFTLMLTYLGEHSRAEEIAGAFAAYVTGNVASNLFGRMISAGVADHFGLSANFLVFAALNLAGAVLVFCTVDGTPLMTRVHRRMASPMAAVRNHLKNGRLRAAFAIGFCILFAFIGVFTYVNFVLVRSPLDLGMMAVGYVYTVFLPSIVTTPAAGRLVTRLGGRTTMWGALAVAAAGLPLLLLPSLPSVIVGMVLVGVGTFQAQAVATGVVGRAADSDRGAASGLYLAAYFSGGLAGSAVLGELFDLFGWSACVLGVFLALTGAALLTFWLTPSRTQA